MMSASASVAGPNLAIAPCETTQWNIKHDRTRHSTTNCNARRSKGIAAPYANDGSILSGGFFDGRVGPWHGPVPRSERRKLWGDDAFCPGVEPQHGRHDRPGGHKGGSR